MTRQAGAIASRPVAIASGGLRSRTTRLDVTTRLGVSGTDETEADP
jgi:hypothetical protein